MMKRRLTALSVSIIVCLCVLFSCTFLAKESRHDCGKPECHICVEIQACNTLLNSMIDALLMTVSLLGIVYCLVKVFNSIQLASKDKTLVSLKVKLTI